MKRFKIKGIDEKDVTDFINSFTLRGFNALRCDNTSIEIDYYLDPCDYDLGKTMSNIASVLISKDYDYYRFFDSNGSAYYAIYDCNKKHNLYDSLYDRYIFKDQINSIYDTYVCTDIEALKQASNNFYRNKYHSGYKKRRGDMYKVNAIYNGIERATGKFKTVVKWSDGTKTIVTSKNDNHLNNTLAFAYAWVKKQYGSNSAFKRHVDKYVENWGYMGQIFFNDGDYQAQLSVRTKSNDIYDQVALVMTTKDFGGIDKVVDIVEEKTFNE